MGIIQFTKTKGRKGQEMDDNLIAEVLRQVRDGRKPERIRLAITVEGNPFGQPAQRNAEMTVSVQPVYDAEAHTLTLTDVRPIQLPKGFQLSNLFGRDDNGNLAAELDLDEMGYPRQ